MAQENSNSTMEMGTSDTVLVTSKKKQTLTYVIGAAVMVAVVAVVVTLVVLLSGNEGGGADPTEPTPPTEPTTPITTTQSSSTVTSTTAAPTTAPPIEPEDSFLDLESIINGRFVPSSFNGTWTADNNILFRNAFGDLVLYDKQTDSPVVLVSNSSEILQQSARVTQLSPDGDLVLLAYNVFPVFRYSFVGRYATIDIVSGNVTDITPPGVPANQSEIQNFVWGPAGTAFAFVYQNNIYYQSSLNSEPIQITTDGSSDVVYNGIPDWVYEEEVFGSNNAMWFSADGQKLAYATFNDTDVQLMKVPHYGLPGSQYTVHHVIRYPKPGTNNPVVSVTVRNLENNEQEVYTVPNGLAEPILKTVQFVNNDTIALMWTNRVQTELVVQTCPFQSPCTQIFSYNEPEGWIDNIPLMFNQAGNSFVTILPQSVDGRRLKQVVQVTNTGGTWSATSRSNTAHTVAEILYWSSDDVIWYRANHVTDTTQQHIYTVDSDRNVSCFTCDIKRTDGRDCLYNEGTISKDGSRIAVNCAGPNIPQTFIYDSEGNLIKTWDTNEEIASALEDRHLPQTVRIELPSGDIQLQVPHNYLNRTNVPLLVYVYGGPDTSFVTQQWSVDWGTSLVDRWGIAIAQIDGRGSGLRGVDNMFAINRRLGTVEIEDQIAYTRYLQEQHPWLDSNRTCIWGWSYGGYAASLALARGGPIFRCAVAVAPVVDWRFYDTIYTERYMGLPQENPTAYLQSSLLTDEVAEAYRNKRYFLIHGTADDNVHYQHAMLISRLLQRRDVAFTQMSYTDEDHGLVGVRPHLYHALEKFLQENML